MNIINKKGKLGRQMHCQEVEQLDLARVCMNLAAEASIYDCDLAFSLSADQSFCQIVPFQMLLYDFYFSVTLYSVIFSTFDNISLVFKRLTLISVLYICTVASLYYIAEYYYMTPEIF